MTEIVNCDIEPHAAAAQQRVWARIDYDALATLGQVIKNTAYRFTTVSPATHQRINRRAGNEWAASLTDVFGWSRPFKQRLLTPPLFALLRNAGLIRAHADGWRSLLRLSTLDAQHYFHSAYPTDASEAVFFGPDTYRFIRALKADLAPLRGSVKRAVDIGCGAGVGAISIALACPLAEVLAVDINDAALRLTEVNAALAATSNVSTRNSDLLRQVAGSFDLIVSNPPYLLDPAERAYRHGGGELGSGLSLAIVDAAIERLRPGGTLLMYTGVAIVEGRDPFLHELSMRLKRAGFAWRYEEIDPDVFGEELDEAAYAPAERLAAVWLAAVKPLHSPESAHA